MGNGSSYLTTSASGGVASFTTRSAVPIHSLKAYFKPVQNGSGDPSPTNVREISGCGGLYVYCGGKNLYDKNAKDTSNGYVHNSYMTNSGGTSSSSSYDTSEYIPIAGSTTYMLGNVQGSNPSYCFYDSSKTFISGYKYSSTKNITFTSPSNAAFVIISVYQANVDNVVLVECSALPVSWTSSGTIYGGYVDLISGDVVTTHGIKTFDGTEDWNIANNTYYVNLSLEGYVVDYGITWISNMYPFGGYKVNTNQASTDKTFYINSNTTLSFGKRIFLKDSSFADTTELSTYLSTHPLVLCGPLATPTTITTLTPSELNTLRCENNIWNSANDITSVEYDLQENFDMWARKKLIMANSPHIATTTPAGIATFNTDIKAAVKSAKFAFSPVQSGSGDPSPDNVRPISGWDGLTIYHSGSDTSNPTSYSITWQSAGTVYGGYVDIITGDLVATHKVVTFENATGEGWRGNGKLGYAADMPSNVVLTQTPMANYMLSKGYGGGNRLSDWQCCLNSAGTYFLVKPDMSVYSSLTLWEEYLSNNPLVVAFEMVTPTTITTLTPAQINTLKGANNIWSNANGNTTIQYWTH